MPPPISQIDLLIIGAGPAGLMAAAWASRCKLNARIIDEKNTRVRTGQADGLHCRTLEIMDSFGSPSIADKILGQACNPKQGLEEHIERSESVRSGEEDLSRYPQVSLSQGSVEQAFLNFLERDGSLRVERNLTPESLYVHEERVGVRDAYPVEVHMRELGKEERAGSPDSQTSQRAVKEIVLAKYVLGTDGAHSWTRKVLGLSMEGDSTNKHFGVMDFVPLSDFPDTRISCAIHSQAGSIMTLPRERGLVRFYVQLAETDTTDCEFDPNSITTDDIIKTSQDILRPYKLNYSYCDWFSVYTVGQRLASSFSYQDRVFLAGDAVHTHSPTMGAGMNVSMQDSYNLVWKIATAIRTGNADILGTYNTERMEVAKELIEKDRQMSSFYCQGPSSNSKKYQEFREKFRDFVSGVAVLYGTSMLVSATEGPENRGEDSSSPSKRKDSQQSLQEFYAKQYLAPGVVIGQRLPSCFVTNHFTAELDQLHKSMESNGSWRLLIFSGDLANPERFEQIKNLGHSLEAAGSFVHRVTPPNQRIDSVIEILTIHSSNRNDVSGLDLPNILHPWDEKMGWDYWKIFARDNDKQDDIYQRFGIDEERGCLVVCRPDQHVGYIGGLEDLDAVRAFFERILLLEKKLE